MNNFLDAPIIEPFRRLLRSRRFTTSIVAVIVAVVVSLVPGLAEVNTELFVLIATLALALVTGYSWEDATAAAQQNTALADTSLREAVRDAVSVAIADIDFVIDEEIDMVDGTD